VINDRLIILCRNLIYLMSIQDKTGANASLHLCTLKFLISSKIRDSFTIAFLHD